MTSSNKKNPFDFGGSPLGGGGIKFGRGVGYQNPVENPLKNVEVTGNAEEDSHREFDALAEGFRERRAKEDARFKDATDSGYYFAVVFRSNEDRDEFLAKLNMGLEDNWYLNGYDLARKLEIEIHETQVD